jgi:hypothetical protein
MVQLHYQPQQPHRELFRGSCLSRLHSLFINGCEGGGFGDPAGGPIDHPDLVRIQVAAVEGFPDGGQAPGEPAGPGKQAAHVIGLVAQHHRKLIGYEFTWLGPLDSGRTGGCGSGGRLCEPRIGVSHRSPRLAAPARPPPPGVHLPPPRGPQPHRLDCPPS